MIGHMMIGHISLPSCRDRVRFLETPFTTM